MKLIKAMLTVAGLTLASRIFGFVRDILMAAVLGAGPVADAFVVAFKLPNFFRRVSAEGAFSVAFVPIYSERLEQDGAESADQLASRAFSVMLAILGLFCAVMMAAMPLVVLVIAPGFGTEAGDPRFDMAVSMTRITFPYLIFMSVAALIGGVLNARENFAPFAAAPILFNLSMLLALALSMETPIFETAGHALSWGVSAAGVMQCLWLLYFLKRIGGRLTFVRPRIDADMRRVFRQMVPGVIGAGVVHINLFIDLILASLLPEGSISYMYYADRLNQLPLGVVGIAVGTALLPLLSRALAAGQADEARDLFNRALEYCLMLALPAAAALLTLAWPLVHVLFERGEFSAADAIGTSQVLMAYAVGLPAYVSLKILSTVYWSRQDTVTPVKTAIAATWMNTVLALTLIGPLGVVGIALATGVTGWVQVWWLYRGVRLKEETTFDARLRRNAPRIAISAILMGLVLFGLTLPLQGWLHDTSLHKLVALLVLIGAGGIVYALGVTLSGVLNLRELQKFLSRRRAAKSAAKAESLTTIPSPSGDQ